MSDHVVPNRGYWDELSVKYADRGRQNWADTEATWGIWDIPESELGLLAGADGRAVVELGCGTAYVAAWLARAGAHPTGIDNSSAQLATAHRLQHEFDLTFPLLWCDAERAPFASGSFDMAISEYGAALWCDPYRWVPEAARLLRRSGRLVFLTNSPLLMLCAPADEDDVAAGPTMLRDYFGMHRFDWPGDDSIEFHLGHGDWIRLLRDCGFDVEALLELRPKPDVTTRYPFVTIDWARRWPSEEVWIVVKR